MTNQGITQWLPLLAAFVAGTFALLQIRSNNITNARIKWLEDLKLVLADFFSECTTLQLKQGVAKGAREEQMKDKINENVVTYLNKLHESIIEHLKIIDAKHDLLKLNLNPKEALHNKMEKFLDDYMNLFNKIPQTHKPEEYTDLIRKMDAYSNTLILLSRYVVKLEWEKTKRPYISRKWYMMFGKGKQLLLEAMNLQLLPQRTGR